MVVDGDNFSTNCERLKLLRKLNCWQLIQNLATHISRLLSPIEKQRLVIAEQTKIEICSLSKVWNLKKCLGPDPKMKTPNMRYWILGLL